MDDFSVYNDDEDMNFWPVYSDMALAMLIILLLFLLAQFVINTKLISGNITVMQNQEKIRREFLVDGDTSGTHYRKGIADIQRDGNLQLITFSSDVIFQLNKSKWSELSTIGRDLLSDFGRVIAENQKMTTRIQIEGHASWEGKHNFATQTAYNLNNWKLSSRRALTVAFACINQGVDPDKLSFSGRAHYVTLNANEDYQKSPNPAVNRRINVILFYSQEYEGDSPLLR